jgi:RNA polymerase sigma factor (sigma-70 family)
MNAEHLFWNTLARPALRERMIAIAVRVGARDRIEAEDCVQDALVAALTTHAALEDQARADAWFSQIVANATRMRIRARKRLRRGAGADHVELEDELLRAHGDPEQIAVDHESLARIESALRADRDGALLRECLDWDGTLNTLADTRGENVSAIKTRLRRLRLRLREKLEAA